MLFGTWSLRRLRVTRWSWEPKECRCLPCDLNFRMTLPESEIRLEPKPERFWTGPRSPTAAVKIYGSLEFHFRPALEFEIRQAARV